MVKYLFQIALLFTTAPFFAQENIAFAYQIKENTIYKTNMTLVVDGLMHIDANEEMLSQMKALGMESPLKMTQESDMAVVNITQTMNEQGQIPAMMYYEKMDTRVQMGPNPINTGNMFDGLKIYGNYAVEGTFTLDSIGGGNLTDEIQSTLGTTLKQLQNEITFPKEPMAIGDSFENEVPMNIPTGPSNPMKVSVISVYTLKSIRSGLAFFDVDQSISMSGNAESMSILASGEGKGVLAYDTENNFTKSYTTELPMKIQMNMGHNMKMDMEMATKTSLTVTISNKE